MIGWPLIRRHRAVAVAAAAGVLAFSVWLMVATLPRLLTTTPVPSDAAERESAPETEPADARRIQATLFYASADGRALRPVSREVAYGATPAEQARHIAEAQVQPAPDGLISTIPTGTAVRAVYVTSRGEAYVDLSREVVTGHAGGSLNEALTVYALVNAITVNLPDISSVQILIDGQEVDTLTGHLDLRHPISRALDWVQRGSP